MLHTGNGMRAKVAAVFNRGERERLRRIEATLGLLLLAIRMVSATEQASVPRALQFESLPLTRSAQNHLRLRAFINGKPATLEVDSGAPVSGIAVNRLAHFGLTPVPAKSEIPQSMVLNGRRNPIAVAHSLQIGVLNLVDEPMVAVDLGSAGFSDDESIDGILGTDILFPTHAVLDCAAQQLILKVDPNVRGGVPGMDYAGLAAVPIELSSGHSLLVKGSLNGKAARLRIDTGAFMTLLNREFVRGIKVQLRDSPFTLAAVHFEERRARLATISRFSIGEVELRSQEVAVVNLDGIVGKTLLNAKVPVAGHLGVEILQAHNGIIDFGTKTLYLKRELLVSRTSR